MNLAIETSKVLPTSKPVRKTYDDWMAHFEARRDGNITLMWLFRQLDSANIAYHHANRVIDADAYFAAIKQTIRERHDAGESLGSERAPRTAASTTSASGENDDDLVVEHQKCGGKGQTIRVLVKRQRSATDEAA
jgi:hypothetical protein